MKCSIYIFEQFCETGMKFLLSFQVCDFWPDRCRGLKPNIGIFTSVCARVMRSRLLWAGFQYWLNSNNLKLERHFRLDSWQRLTRSREACLNLCQQQPHIDQILVDFPTRLSLFLSFCNCLFLRVICLCTIYVSLTKIGKIRVGMFVCNLCQRDEARLGAICRDLFVRGEL